MLRGELRAWRNAALSVVDGNNDVTSSAEIDTSAPVYDIDTHERVSSTTASSPQTTPDVDDEHNWAGDRSVVLVLNKLDVLDACVNRLLRLCNTTKFLNGSLVLSAQQRARQIRVDAIVAALGDQRLDKVCTVSALENQGLDDLRLALRQTLETKGVDLHQ